MHNDSDVRVIDSRYVKVPFDAAEFIAFARSLSVPMEPCEGWIRSGAHIGGQWKNKISSYRLIGSAQLCDLRVRFELLLVKAQIGVSADDAEEACKELVCAHLRESGASAAFAALLSSGESGYMSFVLRSPAMCEYEIPADVLEYITNSAIKNYLRSCTGLNNSALDGFFSQSCTLFDDSGVMARAKDMDKALRSMKFCDIAVGSGQMVRAMTAAVTRARLRLNRYISGPERTKERFAAHFIAHSLYATDCDAGAVEVARIEVRLSADGSDCTDSHIVWGNVLTEKLFGNTSIDVIATNPPHMKSEQFSALHDQLKGYLSYGRSADLYCYYVERAFNLVRPRGTVAFLTSNRWMRAEYGENMRALLADNNVVEVVDYGNTPIVRGSSTPLCAVTAGREKPSGTFRSVEVPCRLREPLALYAEEHNTEHDSETLGSRVWNYGVDGADELLKKIFGEGIPLGEYVNGALCRGILTGLNEAFIISAERAGELISSNPANAEVLRPFLSGRNVKRFQTPIAKKYLIAIPKGTTNRERGAMEPEEWLVTKYPDIARLLAPYERKAAARSDKGDYWWELRSCKNYGIFSEPKIICPHIVSRISAAMDGNGLLSNDKTSVIASDSYYLLGLLNSKLMDFCFRRLAPELLNGYYALNPALLSSLPIRRMNEKSSGRMDLRGVVERCAMILSKAECADRDAESEHYNIRETEWILDKTVYKLYHIKPTEIYLIENY